MQNLPIIWVELVLIFGGVLAFGWWQLRDLARERAKREQRQSLAREESTALHNTDSNVAPLKSAAAPKTPHAAHRDPA